MPKDLPLITIRSDGTAYIKTDVKKKLMEMADKDMLIRWHSRAVDWCIDNDRSLTERAYHMMLAHRYRELSRMIKSERYSIMDDPEPELINVIHELAVKSDDPELLSMSVRMCLDSNRLAEIDTVLSQLANLNQRAYKMLTAELRLREHRFKDAIDLLNDIGMDCPDGLMVKGVLQLWSDDPIGSRESFVRAKGLMLKDRCIFRMDILLAYEAFALMEMGMTPEAKNALEMSANICRNDKRRAELRRLSERLFPPDSENCVLLERIDIGDVEIPDVLYVPFKHGQSLETESPCKDRGLDTEGCQDLGSEHTCSPKLHPFTVEEDLYLQ